jgi:DNA-binding beta-propeller fold protein YncE
MRGARPDNHPPERDNPAAKFDAANRKEHAMSIPSVTSPHNRNHHCLALGSLCVVALVLGAGIGWGQPVPDTIALPDSLGPLRPGYHLAFGSSTSNIYVASESSDIIVVDGNSFQRIKRINTGTPVGGALLVSQHNKLYCSYPQQGRIGVIDCATNTVIGSIQAGTRPTLLCYGTGSNKLYCGDTIDRTVTVIDCATNGVRAVIPIGAGLTVMAYDPTTNKVYAGTRDAVLAISCSADSVVATIAALKRTTGLYVNKRRQKLYVVPYFGIPDTVYVVSTPTDSIVTGIQTYGWLAPELACNEASDRLYGIADFGGGVIVTKEFDCKLDTQLRQLSVGNYGYLLTKGLVCDSVRNRLYYLYEVDDEGYLVVIDCATLGVVFRGRAEDYPYDFGWDQGRRRVLCVGGWREAALTAFGCDSDSLSEVGVAPLRGWDPVFGPTQLCHVSSVGKLYYRWGDAAGGIGVIDEQTNRVVRHVILPQGSGAGYLAYSRTSDKLYCGARPGLVVLDVATDSVLKLVEIGRGVNGLCWYPEGNKLYCYDIGSPSWYIAVLDCSTDSVIREIPGPNVAGHLDYIGNGLMLCRQGDRLRLIDCVTDSVLVDTVTGGGVAYLEAHTGDGAKIYIAHGHEVDVLDASSLAVLMTIEWGYMATRGDWPLFAYSDSTDKLYWFACDNWGTEPESALVIDTRGDTVVARRGAGIRQRLGCLDHTGRYILSPDEYYDNSLIVYDSQGDSVAAVYSGLPGPVCVKPNPEHGQIYVGCTDVILVYPDAPPGVEETPSAEVRAARPEPTVVKGVLVLGAADSRQNAEYRAGLMDISGRKVLDLHAGANDVRGLAPGVYFVRQAPSVKHEASSVTKVVITK